MERKSFLSSISKCGLGAALLALCPEQILRAGNIPVVAGTMDEEIKHSCDEKMKFAEEWIVKFMKVLDQNFAEADRNKLMECNGKACLLDYFQKQGIKIKPVGFEQFAEKVNNGPNDGSIRIEGKSIHFAYMQNYQGKQSPEGTCLCPFVESKPAGLSPTYCQCSVGYVREYFSQILGQPVTVNLEEAVLHGGKRCRFRIELA